MRILENTHEFRAYFAAKNGLMDVCNIDTLSDTIQPGDKSIDLALAGAASAGKQTLVDFLIEHGADKKYVLLGKIYPLYQSIIQQADADTTRALIEFARYFFHFPYRNYGHFNSSELDNLAFHCGFSRFKRENYNPQSPLPPLDSTDSEIKIYLTDFENCAEITAFLAGIKNDVDLFNNLQRISPRYTDLATHIKQSAIWGAIKENHRELLIHVLEEERNYRIGNTTAYAAVAFNQVDLFFYLKSHEKIRYRFDEINWRLLSHRAAASNCLDLLKWIKTLFNGYSGHCNNDPRLSEAIGYAAMHNQADIINYFISIYPDQFDLINTVAMRIAATYEHNDLIAHLTETSARRNRGWFAGLFGSSDKTVANESLKTTDSTPQFA